MVPTISVLFLWLNRHFSRFSSSKVLLIITTSLIGSAPFQLLNCFSLPHYRSQHCCLVTCRVCPELFAKCNNVSKIWQTLSSAMNLCVQSDGVINGFFALHRPEFALRFDAMLLLVLINNLENWRKCFCHFNKTCAAELLLVSVCNQFSFID